MWEPATSYVFCDLFGLFLVVFHKSLYISFIKQRRRKILLAILYMEANILQWPSTACAITTVHKLHCLPTLTKKHHPYKAEHRIKLTGIRNPDKKVFVSAMQKSCWYFWLQLSHCIVLEDCPSHCKTVNIAYLELYWIISWRIGEKFDLETAWNTDHSFSQLCMYKLDIVIIKELL